jgi:hypothetical protein
VSLKSKRTSVNQYYSCLDCNFYVLQNGNNFVGLTQNKVRKWIIIKENMDTRKNMVYNGIFKSFIYVVIVQEKIKKLFAGGINGKVNQFDLYSGRLEYSFQIPVAPAISMSVFENYLFVGSKNKMFVYDVLDRNTKVFEHGTSPRFVFNSMVVENKQGFQENEFWVITSGGYSDLIEFRKVIY